MTTDTKPKPRAIEYQKLIEGYTTMTRPEQMKARMNYTIRRAAAFDDTLNGGGSSGEDGVGGYDHGDEEGVLDADADGSHNGRRGGWERFTIDRTATMERTAADIVDERAPEPSAPIDFEAGGVSCIAL